jgi:hypothetical protein
MLQRIDRNDLEKILKSIEHIYTQNLSWEADADEAFVEGAVIDDIHQAIFNGEAPEDCAAPYVAIAGENPRRSLSKRRRQEVRNFVQRNWNGLGGVILADQLIDKSIQTVVENHRRRHSLC